MAYELTDFEGLDLSVAFTADLDSELVAHLDKGPNKEDLTFAYWRPSEGATRFTAVINTVNLPRDGDRVLDGNVSFREPYVLRVLAECPQAAGIALIHSHLGPGWQAMSRDDVVAERDRLAGAVAGRTGLPLLGLTRGTDGAWSARIWVREGPRRYTRLDARTVRVVGSRLRISYHPDDRAAQPTESQPATLSVWGREAQDDIVRARIGIVGLGSVGSLVADALARMGATRLTFIDFDRVELRNLDRTQGATRADVIADLSKVQVAARSAWARRTAEDLDLRTVDASVVTIEGMEAALDCDVLVSCVDRPWPRFALNAVAYNDLIPVIDGGIMAKVHPRTGRPLHVDWRIHTVGPEHTCMVCLGALRMSDVALDREGKLDDPEYIKGLSEAERQTFQGRNVYPFSMSVASHEVLQLVGLISGMPRIGGCGAQMYHAYPGTMEIVDETCTAQCPFQGLTGIASDLSGNLMTAG